MAKNLVSLHFVCTPLSSSFSLHSSFPWGIGTSLSSFFHSLFSLFVSLSLSSSRSSFCSLFLSLSSPVLSFLNSRKMTSLFDEEESHSSSSSSSSSAAMDEEAEQQEERREPAVSKIASSSASSSLGGMRPSKQQREQVTSSDCSSAVSSEVYGSAIAPSHLIKTSSSPFSCRNHEGEEPGGTPNSAGLSRLACRMGEEGTATSSSSPFSHNTAAGCTYTLEDRHMIWRKNAALHYSCVLSHRLDWPSMTVSFHTVSSLLSAGLSLFL